MPQPLTCQRAAFSLPYDLHYLNCAYMGPLPQATEEAIVRGLRRKRVPADIEVPDFFRDTAEIRRLFGLLVNGDPERVAIMPAASYGISTCARNLPISRGQSIVLTGEQFPGNVYAWRRLATEAGANIRTVEAPEGPGRGERWNARLLEAIDSTTAVVAVPHVHWTDGTRFDLASVSEQARGVGAALVVDGTQSVGALPFDVPEIQPDAVICACYKWLLGPYATTVAYMGERFDGGVPLEETWMGREGSEDFQRLVDYQDTYQPGARRYDMGEVANFALLPGLVESLRLVAGWKPARVQSYCGELTKELMSIVGERGFSVEDRRGRGEHLFGIRMRPDVELARLKSALDAAGVVASLRGTALRVSPNVYNDQRDLAALTEVLAGF